MSVDKNGIACLYSMARYVTEPSFDISLLDIISDLKQLPEITDSLMLYPDIQFGGMVMNSYFDYYLINSIDYVLN